MTERKPPELSFRTWIDQQIEEAQQRGEFDDLPGTGKPLALGDDRDDGQSWIREYVKREGVSPEVFLPEPLKLRKESERLAEAVTGLPSEQAVRDAVGALNQRITQWRRIPVGPPIVVRLVDEEAMLAGWRAAHPPEPPPAADMTPERAARRRWRRRRKR
jgi:hypothetical protein